LGTYATREQRCMSPGYTHGYIRAFDGLIDRPIAPYLFIFHRVLAPGTISSFSFHCVRTRGGKKYEIPTPTLSTRVWHSINFFFVASPKSLPKPIDCHIPARRKNEAADVPSLLTPTLHTWENFWVEKILMWQNRSYFTWLMEAVDVIYVIQIVNRKLFNLIMCNYNN